MNAIDLYIKAKNNQTVKIIDIRVSDRYETFHIPGAINLNIGQLVENPEQFLTKKDKWYVTCNSGNASTMATSILAKQGYDVENVEQGMNPLVNIFQQGKLSELK